MRPVPTQPSVLSLRAKSGTAANVCTDSCAMSSAPKAAKVAPAPAPCNRLQDPIGEVTRNGTTHLRDDGRRLGRAGALRPPARGAPHADLVAARRVGAG